MSDAAATPLRVLVVEDERPARRKLRRMLEDADGIEEVREAPDAALALELLEDFAPDVIFLDIRMPGMDGFTFLRELGTDRDVEIVFVTAHDEHAVRAFDVRAVDYLLKPFDVIRFRTALERARSAVEARRAAAVEQQVGSVLDSVRRALAASTAGRLLVESEPGRRVLVTLQSVVRIEAERNDARLHAGGRSYRLRSTLSDLESRLDADRFMRINRSEIVNLDHVLEFEPLDHGDANVHMADGTVRRMTRRFRDRMHRFE
jgi:two-component system, LytTR family, response regulator